MPSIADTTQPGCGANTIPVREGHRHDPCGNYLGRYPVWGSVCSQCGQRVTATLEVTRHTIDGVHRAGWNAEDSADQRRGWTS